MRLDESRGPIAARIRSIPWTCDRTQRPRSQRPTMTSRPSMRTAATAAIAHRLRLRTDDLHQQLFVAADGDQPVGFGDDVLAPASAHVCKLELTVVRASDRLGQQFGPARRDDDAA